MSIKLDGNGSGASDTVQWNDDGIGEGHFSDTAKIEKTREGGGK